MVKKYCSVRGTVDFDAEQTRVFNFLKARARQVFNNFCYREITLPLLEEKDLFIRGVGRVTDIAEKQIFQIAGKESIALRPEGTAQVVRYYLENSLFKKGDFYKFSYFGPMFRGERPQKGRLRQFHHIGAESIGSFSPRLDAEIIILLFKLLDAFGLKQKTLIINSLGCVEDKRNFARKLVDSLSRNKHKLCPDCRRRLELNPLRVIDCKNKDCRSVVGSLELGKEILCAGCEQHFKEVLSLLDDAKVPYLYDSCLVRGLDYYTNTVFEVTSNALGAQDALAAGGRYNNLIAALGGPEVAACGFAVGAERVLIALGQVEFPAEPFVFVAVTDAALANHAFSLIQKMRSSGINCDMDFCGKSLKSQMRLAQKNQARLVVILGSDELRQNSLLLKDMDSSSQEKIPVGDLLSRVKHIFF